MFPQGAVHPHYEGIDIHNEDQMYIQYLYSVRPREIEKMMVDCGYQMNTPNDVLWAVQQEMQGNEPFIEWLFELDPMHADHAHLFGKRNGSTIPDVVTNPTNGNGSTTFPQGPTNHAQAPCSKDDILCMIRETVGELHDALTLKVKFPTLIIIGIGVIAFVLLYKNNKTAA
jgi:hypothetical protein